MKTLMHKEYSGAVSLIISVIIAIILGVLTVGFVRLMVDEGRQASDDDLTTRAFYATESGVEDAKRVLEPYITGEEDIDDIGDVANPDCGAPIELSGDSGYETYVTCQKIEVDLDDYVTDIDAGQTIQIPLNAVSGDFDTVRIKWHNKTEDDSYSIKPPIWGPKGTDPTTDWNDAPAALKAALVSYPDSGAFRRSDILHKEVYVSPDTKNASTISMEDDDFYNAGHISPDAVSGACVDPTVTSQTYACETHLSELDSSDNQYILRITALYANTEVSVELLNTSSGVTIVEQRNGQAKVDTTGRAGDVLRRVQVRLLLSATNEEGEEATFLSKLLPSFAITSNNVCKNMRLTNDPADFPAVNNLSTADLNNYNYCAN